MTNTKDLSDCSPKRSHSDSNIIPLPVTAAKTATEPQKLDLDDYAERLAISLGWHVFATDGGPHDNKCITKTPCATLAERQRVPALWISQDWRKGKRIIVTASWPWSEAAGVCAPSGGDAKIEATFSPAKEPAQVARELSKRTLPMYLAQHAVQMTKIAEWEAHRDAGDALASRIQAALGIERTTDRDGKRRKDFYAPDADGNVGAHVQVSGESVALQITGLAEEQAMRILEIVRGG